MNMIIRFSLFARNEVVERVSAKVSMYFYRIFARHGDLILYLALVCDISIYAPTCDFQQCDILTSVDSDEAAQPPFKLKNSK